MAAVSMRRDEGMSRGSIDVRSPGKHVSVMFRECQGMVESTGNLLNGDVL